MSDEHVPLLFSMLRDLIAVPKIKMSFLMEIVSLLRSFILLIMKNLIRALKFHFPGSQKIIFLGPQYVERRGGPDPLVTVFLEKYSPFGHSYQLPGTDQ